VLSPSYPDVGPVLPPLARSRSCFDHTKTKVLQRRQIRQFEAKIVRRWERGALTAKLPSFCFESKPRP
jgi:hypothetical protein